MSLTIHAMVIIFLFLPTCPFYGVCVCVRVHSQQSLYFFVEETHSPSVATHADSTDSGLFKRSLTTNDKVLYTQLNLYLQII